LQLKHHRGRSFGAAIESLAKILHVFGAYSYRGVREGTDDAMPLRPNAIRFILVTRCGVE
jgi:hypothetical protein